MDQIKERCIYCGSDVYYIGTEVLIKCGMCGHTLVVAKFENEQAKMKAALEEGEEAKKDLAEAEKARRVAEARLQEAVESLAGIKDGQDVLSQLMKSVMVGQDTAEGKLAQVQSVSERILKNQGNLFEGMHILDEIKDHLQLIGMDAKASQDYAMSFMTWFQNIHEGDKARLENAAKQSSELLVEQKKINEKIDLLHQSAEKTQKTLDDFHSQWKESQLEELRQLYHQAENLQQDRMFDKAEQYYRQVLVKGGDDLEVYWRLLMCHYCLTYQTNDEGDLIPIILNPDLTSPEEMSLRKDLAVQMKAVPSEQKAVYEEELGKIDRILNKYRLIRGSVSYDVFISVKQQRDGNPTRDSFAAVTLYNTLSAKGLKVFNSRLTPPPAGQEYEPYIISALMSAKAMIVVGSCRENMEAQWVKNEWSRFQWLQYNEKKLTGKTDRVLLCYLAEGMKPEMIPRGLNPNRQAIKDGIAADKQLEQALTFLISGKRRTADAEHIKMQTSAEQTISQMKTWLFRGKYDKVLDRYESLNENGLYLDQAQVHLCAICAEKGVSGIDKLVESEVDFRNEPLYQLALEVSQGTNEYPALKSKLEKNISWHKKSSSAPFTSEGKTLGKAGTLFLGLKQKFEKTENIVKKDQDLEKNEPDEKVQEEEAFQVEEDKDKALIQLEKITIKSDAASEDNVQENEEEADSFEAENDSEDSQNKDELRNNQKKLPVIPVVIGTVLIVFIIWLSGKNFNRGSQEAKAVETNTSISTETMEAQTLSTMEKEESEPASSESDSPVEDTAIDWKDENLEKKIREITGIYDRDISFNDVNDLTMLNLSDSHIKDVSSLAVLKNLDTLYLYSNDIEDISRIKEMKSLTYLDVRDNPISDDSQLDDLEIDTLLSSSTFSYISEMKDEYVIDWKDEKLEETMREITGIDDREIVYGDVKGITELELKLGGITDISALACMTNLTSLTVMSNKVTDIKCLANLTNLTYLDLYYNPISDIRSLAGLKNLTYLCLDNDDVEDIRSLEGLVNLQVLDLGANEVVNIDSLSGLINLEELDLWGNDIKDISSLENLKKLENLWLLGNDITDYSPLKKMTNLKYINLEGTKIDLKYLEELVNLEELNIADNEYTDISKLVSLTNLSYLDLRGNNIKDFSILSELPNLTGLSLSFSNITDISSLAKLTSLTELDLQGNEISDISSLANLTNLTKLNLWGNPITDYSPIEGLNIEELSK